MTCEATGLESYPQRPEGGWPCVECYQYHTGPRPAPSATTAAPVARQRGTAAVAERPAPPAAPTRKRRGDKPLVSAETAQAAEEYARTAREALDKAHAEAVRVAVASRRRRARHYDGDPVCAPCRGWFHDERADAEACERTVGRSFFDERGRILMDEHGMIKVDRLACTCGCQRERRR